MALKVNPQKWEVMKNDIKGLNTIFVSFFKLLWYGFGLIVMLNLLVYIFN